MMKKQTNKKRKNKNKKKEWSCKPNNSLCHVWSSSLLPVHVVISVVDQDPSYLLERHWEWEQDQIGWGRVELELGEESICAEDIELELGGADSVQKIAY